MNNRVYNDKVNVDDKNIKAFFSNRDKCKELCLRAIKFWNRAVFEIKPCRKCH